MASVKEMRKTKIVCTIGPASSGSGVLEEMVQAGMDVARLNFSHGSMEEHKGVINRIRRISKAHNRPLAIMQDLPGPKIRTGEVGPEPVVLKKGGNVIITGKKLLCSSQKISVSYAGFVRNVRPGNAILIDDGKIKLRVVDVYRDRKEVMCRVVEGGPLKTHKGVNLPDTDLDIDALTENDKKYMAFGLDSGVDLVALSFVGCAKDILAAKHFMKLKRRTVPIIAKIERRQALSNLDGILEAADGVMVARGDLGVETDLEDVPVVQKKIIHACVLMGKPVITATQMLESMVSSSTPTRAEVADVANAVLDGTDAVMLSEETAVGKYPVNCVRMMKRIALKAEASMGEEDRGGYVKFLADEEIGEKTIQDAITHSAHHAARDVKARAIIACTTTGKTARMVARHRPDCPIIGVSPSEDVLNQLCLTRGVYPARMKVAKNTDEMMREAEKVALKTGLVKKGDTVVITAGYPYTNLLKAYTI